MIMREKTQMLNASMAAEKIGCSIATVTRWANRLELGVKIGTMTVLSEKEVATIKETWCKSKGNPNFVKK